MRCNSISLLIAIFLFSPAIVNGQQNSSAPVSALAGIRSSTIRLGNCSSDIEALRAAKQAAEVYQRASETQSDPKVASGTADEPENAAGLEQDLKLTAQSQTELTQCVLGSYAQAMAQDSPDFCPDELLMTFEFRHDGEPERDIPIARLPGTQAFFYVAGMTIDADGAPNAYHPDNTGLDDLANAGTPGRWEGLAKDADGEPFIQGPNDPFPGYYVSATALADRSKPVNDPTRYVDASRIPFIVLPGGMARQLGARPGDFAAAFNQRSGKFSFAIFGDVGPYDRIGEGSVALAENLGIRSDARNGGARRGILYLVFPGSGNGRPRTIEEINAEGQKLVQDWESSISPEACAASQPAQGTEGNRSAN
jgi:Fungal chitosanase of glycosyl hydrolase group 75